MYKTNVPLKVAIGYGAVAIVLVLAIALVYSNTTSLLAINRASREYVQKRDAADSTMSALLKEEQDNLKDLSDAMAGNARPSYLHEKVNSLNNGKDSIVVHPKTAQTHEAKNTTVEVVKTRKGFFRRLADVFKKEHAETLSVKKDSNRAVIDTISAPVNVADKVADVLEQIDKQEKKASRGKHQAVSKEMADLQMVSAQLALRSAQQLNDIHKKERESMQQAINKAMMARQHLLWQIGLLAVVAVLAAIILLYYIYRDTHKERIYRENLEEANEEIQRIMNQRERLLLTITHDIKAPAASISGFIDLMKDYVTDQQGIDCLRNIKGSATHLSQLVASLLDYHQLENGLMEVHPATFSPKSLVEQSVEGMRIQAEQKGLEISYELEVKGSEIGKGGNASSTMPSLFQADAFRIRQILDNLVSNAIKYTDKGSVHVKASIMPLRRTYISKDNYQLTLTVQDTGKGMTTAESQKVFQAFTRLKSAQGIEGTGLGLSITHELVTLLGGDIRLCSEVGKGSTFIVVLPLEEASAEEEGNNQVGNNATTNVPSTSQDKASTTKKPFTNHKILILDDDKLQLQLLQEMLRRLVGDTWQVFACNHVTEALTTIHQEQPTLMMMDIEMPEMNGMEMIKHINHSHMTVIAMTAHDHSIKEQLQQAGFDDCLFKPFHKESLAAVLGLDLEKASVGNSEKVSASQNKAQEAGNSSKGRNSQFQREKLPVSPRETISPRLKPLLAFAEDDAEAAAEIIQTVKQELETHLHTLNECLQEESLDAEKISKAAHKLLPIATMIKMECLQQLQDLSPELIHEMETQKIRECVQVVITDLQAILGEW